MNFWNKRDTGNVVERVGEIEPSPSDIHYYQGSEGYREIKNRDFSEPKVTDKKPGLWNRVKSVGSFLSPKSSTDAIEPQEQPELILRRQDMIDPPPSMLQNIAKTSTSLAAAAGNHIIKMPSNMLKGIAAVGRNLKNPETRRQTAVELVANMAAMNVVKIAAGSAMASVGTPLLAATAGLAATTGIVGGLLKSNQQYKAAKAEWEANPENNEEEFQNRRSYLWQNKKQFAVNFAASALTGAVGSAIGAGLNAGIGAIFHHAATSGIPSHDALKTSVPTAADHAAANLKAPITHAEAPIHHVSAVEAQHLKDQAVREFWHGDRKVGIEKFHEAAAAGNAQAIRDLASLQKAGLLPADAAPASAPTPVQAPHVSAPAAEPVAPHLKLDVSTWTTEDVTGNVLDTVTPEVIAGATATGGLVTAAGAYGVQKALENSLGATQDAAPDLRTRSAIVAPLTPEQIQENARVANVIDMRRNGVSVLGSGFLGLEKGTCYISRQAPQAGSTAPQNQGTCSALESTMEEGDFIRVIGEDTGISTAAYATAPQGQKVGTECFMDKLVSVRKTFNTLMQVVNPFAVAPAEANDNEISRHSRKNAPERSCALN